MRQLTPEEEMRSAARWAYLPMLGLLVASAVVCRQLGIPLAALTRDPLAIADVHPLYGALSNIGILLWCTTVAVCFFTLLVLAGVVKWSDTIRLIAGGGVLTAWLMFDDLFSIHEDLLPQYLGIGEGITFGVYFLLTGAYLIRFRAFLLGPNPFLRLAIGFFSFSLLADVLPDSILPLPRLREDGTKLVGIVSWATFYITICRQALRSVFCSRAPSVRSGEEPEVRCEFRGAVQWKSR